MLRNSRFYRELVASSPQGPTQRSEQYPTSPTVLPQQRRQNSKKLREIGPQPSSWRSTLHPSLAKIQEKNICVAS